jgi:2-amino-4-hydroxy-6-hydroxymethyldihydropteridine diphosphokinase
MLQDRDTGISTPVFIGIGSNLASSRFGPPLATAAAALGALAARGIPVLRCSRWYASSPLPASDQPDFVNAVAEVKSTQEPTTLMAALHEIEAAFGRKRSVVNAARVLDLDLLAMGRRVRDNSPTLPHPRLHLRAFVLRPLAELAPDWRHPLLDRTASELLAALPPGQCVSMLPGPSAAAVLPKERELRSALQRGSGSA